MNNGYDIQSHQSQILARLTQDFPNCSVSVLTNLIHRYNGDYNQITAHLRRPCRSLGQPNRPMPQYYQNPMSRPSPPIPQIQVSHSPVYNPRIPSHLPLELDVRPEVLPSGDEMCVYYGSSQRPVHNYTKPPSRTFSQLKHLETQKKAKNELANEVQRLKKVERSHARLHRIYKEMLDRVNSDPSFPTEDDLEELRNQIRSCQPAVNPIYHSVSSPASRVSTPDRSSPQWRIGGQEFPSPVSNLMNSRPDINNLDPNHPAYVGAHHMVRNESAPSQYYLNRLSHSPVSSSSPAPENAHWRSFNRVTDDEVDRSNSNTQWACQKCTFNNNGMLNVCEICNESRPLS